MTAEDFKGLVASFVQKRAGAERPERRPHHAAARRRRRRRRRDDDVVPRAICIRRSAWRWSATTLYVANTDAVLRFPYATGATQLIEPGEPRSSICRPARSITTGRRTCIASPDGTKLYVDGRLEQQRRRERHRQRSTIARRFSRSIPRRGIRCACSRPGCAIRTAWRGSRETGELWTVVNERDELGNDLVPDYLTSVRDGGFYGWPYSYYGAARRRAREAAAPGSRREGDRARLRARRAHRVARPRVLSTATRCRTAIANGAFVGQHGSWNRKPRSGYKVIFVPFSNGKPSGPPEDVLTGFRRRRGRRARPPGRRRDRPKRRAARRRRRRQHGVAGSGNRASSRTQGAVSDFGAAAAGGAPAGAARGLAGAATARADIADGYAAAAGGRASAGRSAQRLALNSRRRRVSVCSV